jgi:hypothetical protein
MDAISHLRIMRTPTAIVALLTSILCCAQSFDRLEVVNVDSTRSAVDLYRTAERWFIDTFKDSQRVFQLRDSVAHTIVGKGGLQITGTDMVVFSMEVAAKDGRYRVKLYDISLNQKMSLDWYCNRVDTLTGKETKRQLEFHRSSVEYRKGFCESSRLRLDNLMASLKTAMSKPKDDW